MSRDLISAIRKITKSSSGLDWANLLGRVDCEHFAKYAPTEIRSVRAELAQIEDLNLKLSPSFQLTIQWTSTAIETTDGDITWGILYSTRPVNCFQLLVLTTVPKIIGYDLSVFWKQIQKRSKSHLWTELRTFSFGIYIYKKNIQRFFISWACTIHGLRWNY